MDLNKFFEDYPAVTKKGVAEEAGVSLRLISYILKGEHRMTEEVRDKLKPVLKKYGCYEC